LRFFFNLTPMMLVSIVVSPLNGTNGRLVWTIRTLV
jgi:hypothetical protein